MLDKNLLCKAFESSIDVLGATANQGLIEDLKVFGMHLNDPELSLQKPMQGLQEVLGEEATIVLISRIFKKMDELYSSKT